MRSQNYNALLYRLKSLLLERKQGVQLLISNFFGNGIILLMNFLLPFFLSSSGYGQFALLYALFNLFTAIFTFGLDSSILKFSIDKIERPNILIHCFYVWIVLSTVMFVLLIPAVWIFFIKGFLKIGYFSTLVTIFSAFITSFQRVVLYYYISKSNVKKYGFLFVLNKVVQFLLFIFVALVFSEKNSIEFMPFLFLIQGIITFVAIYFLENKNINFTFPTKAEFKMLTKFTMPLSFETFGNIGYSYGFNLFISPFLSFNQLGVLNIYTQLGNIVSMTLGAMNNGFLPRLFKEIETNFRFIVKQFSVYIFSNGVVISVGVFFLGILYRCLSASLSKEYSLLLLLVYLLGMFLYSFKSLGSSYLIYESKTSRIALITVVTSVLNIILGVIITTNYGFFGCVLSLSIGYIIQTVFFNFSVIRKFIHA